MDDQPGLININTASVEELTTIPGIGHAMAERIIAARPFGALDDLRRVSGIGPAALERLRLLVTFTDDGSPIGTAEPEIPAPAEPPVPAEEAQAPVEAMEPEPVWSEPALAVDEAPVEAAPEVVAPEPVAPAAIPELPAKQAAAFQAAAQPPAPQSPAYITRMQALGMSLTTGVITFLLALAFALGFLSLVNGGLRYASPQQLSGLGQEVEGIASGLEILQQDMEGVRSRLSNLEGLSGRVSEVERSTANLGRDLEAASGRIGQLEEQARTLGAQVEEMQARTNRFQGFLDGLRELINGVFKP